MTINRPDSLNSLTIPVITGMADALELAAADPGVKVVRRGVHRFCLSGHQRRRCGRRRCAARIIAEAKCAIRAITALPRPVVAVVHGPAAGVGVSLALACDLVLASEKAFFMLAFTQVGLMPDGGASALVAAAVGRIRAMRMALLPERLPATEALSWGLVSAVYPADDFDAEVDKVLARLAAGPAVAFAKTKDAINAATLTELDNALDREFKGQVGLVEITRLHRGRNGIPARPAPLRGLLRTTSAILSCVGSE